MKVWTRLFPEFDGEVRFTKSAVANLIGQRPTLTMLNGRAASVEILDAAIEDGWVVVQFDSPEPIPS